MRFGGSWGYRENVEVFQWFSGSLQRIIHYFDCIRRKMSFTTIIYAHPYEQSFNYGILQRVQQLLDEKGEKYQLIDLYEDGFNPAYTKE